MFLSLSSQLLLSSPTMAGSWCKVCVHHADWLTLDSTRFVVRWVEERMCLAWERTPAVDRDDGCWGRESGGWIRALISSYRICNGTRGRQLNIQWQDWMNMNYFLLTILCLPFWTRHHLLHDNSVIKNESSYGDNWKISFKFNWLKNMKMVQK